MNKTREYISWIISAIIAPIVGVALGLSVGGNAGLCMGLGCGFITLGIVPLFIEGIREKVCPLITSGCMISIICYPLIILFSHILFEDERNPVLIIICIILFVIGLVLFFILLKQTENEINKKITELNESLAEDDDDIPSEVLEKLPKAYEEISSQMDGKDVLL